MRQHARFSPLRLERQDEEPSFEIVQNIECRRLAVFGNITILEATAGAQERLVEYALEDESERLPSGDPYGAVLWPASLALAEYLLEIPRDWESTRVWEVGTGTGLVSLVLASRAKPCAILATDYEQLPLEIVKRAAQLNRVQLQTTFFDINDIESLPDADLLVAADVMYEPTTGSALAKLVRKALAVGMEVVVADSPGRAGRPDFLNALEDLDVEFKTYMGTTITTERHDLICGSNSQTISDNPKPLEIAIMHLHPDMIQ